MYITILKISLSINLLNIHHMHWNLFYTEDGRGGFKGGSRGTLDPFKYLFKKKQN